MSALHPAAVKFIRPSGNRSSSTWPTTPCIFRFIRAKNGRARSPNGHYSDWVEEVDWSVGQVLDTLRGLHLDSRTFVLFTSDNGGTPRAVNAPLRGFKGSTWEGGMREPTIAWWPGKIPADTATDAITACSMSCRRW